MEDDRNNRLLSSEDNYGIGAQNINPSFRELTNSGVNNYLPTNTSNIDFTKSPADFRYTDKNNMGDLSPFGGMRKTFK